MNRRRLLKTFGLGALATVPAAVSAEGDSEPMSRLHPVAVLRRIASFQYAQFQAEGVYADLPTAFGRDASRIPDDHPLKSAFLQGRGFDRFGLNVRFRLGADRRGFWATAGPGQAPSRFYVDEKLVIYRSTDDQRWSTVDLDQVGPRGRSWTPITRDEFEKKSASSNTVFSVVASVLNAVVPVVQARSDHSGCCNDSFPGWWWSCWQTQTSGSCLDENSCNCQNGRYYCVQGFEDCTGCCINCGGNCECVWDLCPGS